MTSQPEETEGGALSVPTFATIVADSLLIRREPGLDGEPIVDFSGCVDAPSPCERPYLLGTEDGYRWVYLFDGPVAADGYEWYLAATEMNIEEHASTHPEAIGWVAAGDETDDWLVPDERSCPAQPIELADVTNLALTKLEMLHCLGNERLTLRGWYPSVSSEEELRSSADYLEECRSERYWLSCASIFDILRVEEADWAGGPDYVDFVVDPAAGVIMPERSQWITVTGSFDHPESSECGDVAAILQCRYTFVIDSARPG